VDSHDTDNAVVSIDPQNDVLSENRATWGVAGGEGIRENRLREPLERGFEIPVVRMRRPVRGIPSGATARTGE
jgi:hypothetical protein